MPPKCDRGARSARPLWGRGRPSHCATNGPARRRPPHCRTRPKRNPHRTPSAAGHSRFGHRTDLRTPLTRQVAAATRSRRPACPTSETTRLAGTGRALNASKYANRPRGSLPPKPPSRLLHSTRRWRGIGCRPPAVVRPDGCPGTPSRRRPAAKIRYGRTGKPRLRRYADRSAHPGGQRVSDATSGRSQGVSGSTARQVARCAEYAPGGDRPYGRRGRVRHIHDRFGKAPNPLRHGHRQGSRPASCAPSTAGGTRPNEGGRARQGRGGPGGGGPSGGSLAAGRVGSGPRPYAVSPTAHPSGCRPRASTDREPPPAAILQCTGRGGAQATGRR